jgi:general stress protein 26
MDKISNSTGVNIVKVIFTTTNKSIRKIENIESSIHVRIMYFQR